MKKLIATAMIAIVFVSVLCVFSGCGSEVPTYDDTELYYEIESLKDRIENLENKNNVFWTDKAEYGEHETMTVYFKDTAVFEIRLRFDTGSGLAFGIANNYVINGSLYIKSLVSDILADYVIDSSYILCESGTAFKKAFMNS